MAFSGHSPLLLTARGFERELEHYTRSLVLTLFRPMKFPMNMHTINVKRKAKIKNRYNQVLQQT